MKTEQNPRTRRQDLSFNYFKWYLGSASSKSESQFLNLHFKTKWSSVIKRLTWKEEKVFCLNTNAGRVAIKMRTGHWSNNSSLDLYKLVFHNKKQTAVLQAATYGEAISDLGLSCGTSVRLWFQSHCLESCQVLISPLG